MVINKPKRDKKTERQNFDRGSSNCSDLICLSRAEIEALQDRQEKKICRVFRELCKGEKNLNTLKKETKMAPSTLNDLLKKMKDWGLFKERIGEKISGFGGYEKIYSITPEGIAYAYNSCKISLGLSDDALSNIDSSWSEKGKENRLRELELKGCFIGPGGIKKLNDLVKYGRRFAKEKIIQDFASQFLEPDEEVEIIIKDKKID